MIDNDTQAATARSARRWGGAAALVAAGLAGGVILAGTVTANAATPTPSSTSSTSTGSGTSGSAGTSGATGRATTPNATMDPSKPQRSDETLLTGDTASQVRALALAKYPNATIERVETDSDGVYEAHIVTAAGAHVIVQVGKDFTVTGTQTGGPSGGKGGPGGVDPDPHDNDGPGTGNPGTPPTSASSPSA
jgi:hypothetical protein